VIFCEVWGLGAGTQNIFWGKKCGFWGFSGFIKKTLGNLKKFSRPKSFATIFADPTSYSVTFYDF